MRLDLTRVFGYRRVQAWRRVGCPPWQAHRIHIGQLGDGRWFVEHTGDRAGAWVYEDRDEAAAKAADLTSAGVWEPCPANPTQDDPRWRNTRPV